MRTSNFLAVTTLAVAAFFTTAIAANAASFADPNLEAAVREEAGVAASQELTNCGLCT
jgi:hypothetical protein